MDGQAFELDVEDTGGQTFGFHALLWREVELLRQIVVAVRSGRELSVAVPDAGLRATFTTAGAYDALQEIETLGQVDN